MITDGRIFMYDVVSHKQDEDSGYVHVSYQTIRAADILHGSDSLPLL